MRAALGASRTRIVRQVLVENCLLALAGGLFGLLLAYWTPQILTTMRAANLPRLDQVRIDWHVLGFSFAIALFTGVLSGVVPALRMTKINLQMALQEGTRGSSANTGGMRSFLVVSEIALSLTLLLGAGLLVRSLLRLVNVRPGFAPAHVLTLRVSPVGPHVHVADPTSPPRTVVGVVGDVHHYALDAAPTMQFYLPVTQTDTSDLVFAVRSAADPPQIANAVRLAIRSVDETLPIYRVVPMSEYVAATMANRRLALVLLGSFAAIALILSVVGIYGVTEYTVAQRTREIGIRMALGAQNHQVLRLMLRQGTTLAVGGVVLGAIFSFALMGFLRSLVFGVTITDPVTFLAASAILTAAATLACWVPSRKVIRMNPTIALRHE